MPCFKGSPWGLLAWPCQWRGRCCGETRGRVMQGDTRALEGTCREALPLARPDYPASSHPSLALKAPSSSKVWNYLLTINFVK